MNQEYIYYMRDSTQSEDPSFLTLTIMIQRQEAYEFMLRCQEKATVGCILSSLQKTYDAEIKKRIVFRDKECHVQVRPDEQALKTRRLYLQFSQAEYEAIIKSLFFGGHIAKNQQKVENNHQANGMKSANGNLSTAQANPQPSIAHKEVSKFQIEDEERIGKEAKISEPKRPQLSYAASGGHLLQTQNNQKANTQTFDTTHNHLLLTDSNSKPEPVSGDCCALI